MTDDEKRIQLVMDYKAAFGSSEGKRVLADLSKLCGLNFVFTPVGTDGHTDPYDVMRHEGMRTVAVHINRIVETDLMKEHELQTDNTQEHL